MRIRSTCMAMYVLRTSLITLITFITAPAFSASHESTPLIGLSGLRTFVIDVVDLNESAARCGILKIELENRLRFILGQSSIRIVDDTADGAISLEVNVLRSCASNVQLSVFSRVTLHSTGKASYAVTWQEGFLQDGRDARTQIGNSVESLVRQLVNEWNLVNK
jgi:hypothetical protein